MKNENTRNPEPFELVGSKDLRESFKDTDRIRGSFFINGVELHQFEANSPASVVAQINAKSNQHFVTAEIDDGGHLVLIERSGAEIMIRDGAAYVDVAPASTGDAAKDVLASLRHEQEQHRKGEDKDKNTILEALGLEANDRTADAQAGNDQAAPTRLGFETGLSAEDRRKRWEDEQGLSNPARGPSGGARPGDVTQIPSNPTPGNTGAAGKLQDGRGRTGTGGGSGETLGKNVADAHAPAA
jgi:hypothetical protein